MEYGLIGEKLGHSFSPELHRELADYDYQLCPLSPQELPGFMQRAEFRAINVTIPYKEKVMPFLTEIDARAQAIGAVNTIVNNNGRLYGHNTDFAGFDYLLQKHGIDPQDKNVLIMGAGGAGKCAAAVLASRGAAKIYQADRVRGENLITYEEAQQLADVQIIVNATPSGMYPANDAPLLLNLSRFPRLEAVADVVYNPLKTNLVLTAEELGLTACGGLEMLVAQAKFAAEYFLDTQIPDSEIDRIYQKLLRQKQNIALIGMPGSGKTTVGQILAKLCGKTLVDSDAQVEKTAGKTIKEIFEAEGEAAFRQMEAQTIAAIAKQDGQIIATGGGAVLDFANVQNLRQNSILIWLDKPAAELSLNDKRPLSPNQAANIKLYQQRQPLYQAAADLRIENCGTAEEAAEAVLAQLRWHKEAAK
ncbi:MAG TPA: shikimate dehydrogenase [Candidatus Avidehalobacter gallistercoris]|uniref:Shikimate kinase n=1 Tax=Candidatus Avidehalobacter gallistercoris TaxID=2840694 RepID=A0A9D1KZL2_9FIRM|nr:shikimate dehydrogenase [Candidatus Avidehalobacter gallistercoris]